MLLLPHPRSLKRQTGFYTLPDRGVLHLDAEGVRLSEAERVQAVAEEIGVELEIVTGPPQHPRLAIRAFQGAAAPEQPEGYALVVGARGVALQYRDSGGLRAGVATLRQLLRQYGRRLPRVTIRDYPDFARRGVMLDIS